MWKKIGCNIVFDLALLLNRGNEKNGLLTFFINAQWFVYSRQYFITAEASCMQEKTKQRMKTWWRWMHFCWRRYTASFQRADWELSRMLKTLLFHFHLSATLFLPPAALYSTKQTVCVPTCKDSLYIIFNNAAVGIIQYLIDVKSRLNQQVFLMGFQNRYFLCSILQNWLHWLWDNKNKMIVKIKNIIV